MLSVLLFAFHSAAHLVVYLVPRTLFVVLVRTPLLMIESCLGEQRSLPERDDLMAVACNWWDKTALNRFGLVEQGLVYPDPLYGGHMSTVLGASRPVSVPLYDFSVIKAEDGEEIHVDWYGPADRSAIAGVLLILPGLTSTSCSNYIAKFVQIAAKKNFACCVLNARGVGGHLLTRPQLMCAAWTTDVRSVLASAEFSQAGLEQRYGSKTVPIVAVGFSLGGAILSKYMGEEGKAGRPVNVAGAVTICAPWDMHLSANLMQGIPQRILYQGSLTNGLRWYARRNKEMFKQIPSIDSAMLFDRKGINRIRTVQEFDRLIIAPHFGFDSPESYYTAASTLPQYLAHCSVPMLCVSAVGDPVTGAPPLRRWESLAQTNKNVVYVAMPSGGHLGFAGGPLSEFWARCTGTLHESAMEKIVLHAISSLVQSIKQ